jgi:glycosyltransferase involved in cell wall biosynthesis
MWFCSQIGAREHYAVPRALHQAKRLATLYTDYWAGPVTQAIAGGRKMGALGSLAARYQPDLGKVKNGGQKAEIVAWNLRALGWEIMLRQQKSAVRNQYHGFIEVGRRFATCVREELKRRPDLGPDSIFFAYDTGALETLAWCRERGIKCVLNQMDPNRVEVKLVQAEEEQWPGWGLEKIQVPEEYFARREQEWALADRVVVNSEFSRQALLQQGVAAEKLVVVPLCYEVKAETAKAESGKSKSENAEGQNQFQHSAFNISALSPLRVLFLGQVILRKGIQYLMAAAKLLEKENIHFDVVGPIGISREAMATAPGNLTFHGRTGRDQAAGWYQRSQLFVLPTLSDGFAITQLEAMAYGLPVIATPCCGEVVSDGVDGFIVPARDAGALARSFQRYLAQPDLLPAHSAAALVKTRQFTLDRLVDNLRSLEQELVG